MFLATGKHELRGAAPTRSRHRHGGTEDVLTRWQPRRLQDLRRHVELILFAGGYAGLQIVEADRAVLCVLLPAVRLRAVSGRWDGLLDALTEECPHLLQRLAGARPLLDRPLAIAGLPYGYVYTTNRRDPPGLFRLGDQAAVIASLTGDGVALALASGSLAARTWLAGGSGAAATTIASASACRARCGCRSVVHRLCLNPAMQPWVAAHAAVPTSWPGSELGWLLRTTRALTV